MPGKRLEVPVAVQQHKTGQLGDGGNEQVHRSGTAVFALARQAVCVSAMVPMFSGPPEVFAVGAGEGTPPVRMVVP